MKATIPRHDVPYDIIFSILSKSTTKSVLRFTSVSKSINALVRSSAFVAAHHRNQIRNNNNDAFYIVHMPNHATEDQEPCSLRREIGMPTRKYNLSFPFRLYKIIGACEGLICFMKDSDIYIWNPFVGSIKIVPLSRSNNSDVYQFYFSEKSCDYKIIKQITGIDTSLINLEIYSLATDSWRRIECKRPNCFISMGKHVLLKNFIYWMGLMVPLVHEFKEVVFGFDLDTEIFEEATALEPRATKSSIVFRDTWDGVFEGNRDKCIFVICGKRFIPKDYYLIPVKENLMLFDLKDKN